ncbi:hypothetical protein NST08_09520 [Paenibacillus sp. FSL K6-1566]
MKKMMGNLLNKLAMMGVYVLLGYMTYILYLVMGELIKSVYHICFGG